MMTRIKQATLYFGRLTPSDHDWIKSVLSVHEQAYFRHMHPADQFHGYQVARHLGEAPMYVLKAALLHDCGKPRNFGFFARCLVVLLRKFSVPYFREIQRVGREHPTMGAELLKGVLSEDGIELIRRHGDSENVDGWLKELQTADKLY